MTQQREHSEGRAGVLGTEKGLKLGKVSAERLRGFFSFWLVGYPLGSSLYSINIGRYAQDFFKSIRIYRIFSTYT